MTGNHYSRGTLYRDAPLFYWEPTITLKNFLGSAEVVHQAVLYL
jgi:hypothetical protein